MRQELVEFINSAAEDLMKSWAVNMPAQLADLHQSISYSLSNGGKRFRPLLCLMIAEQYAVGPKRVMPLALAIEMIHTYSLIHDDLPCMDNDDSRRGQPTNHKIFGESTALLAGDALLTEAFHHLARSYMHEPELGLKLISLLGEAAGFNGMVGGQVMDISFQQNKTELPLLKKMHSMKTGALIRVSAEGSAVACGLSQDKISLFREFGEKLGLAFQIKDDLLDAQEKIELGSFPGIIGQQEAENYLLKIQKELEHILTTLEAPKSLLAQLVEFNLHRHK